MKKLLTSIFILLTCSTAYAARLELVTPTEIDTSGGAIEVQIVLDPEDAKVGALAATLSFPSDSFVIDSISTENSAVSLWLTSPKVSTERFLDSRTRIVMEGVIPGGFSGVRSPYYEGGRPGVVATVRLFPQKEGSGSFLLDNVQVRASDSSGTLLSDQSSDNPFAIPKLRAIYTKVQSEQKEISNESISVTLSRSELLSSNAWHVIMLDTSTTKTLNHFEIAESREYDPHRVSSFTWRTANSPYVLLYQSRDHYIHVKAVYDDGSYAYKTIPPVENSDQSASLSRILILIALTCGAIYAFWKYYFAHKYPHIFRKG